MLVGVASLFLRVDIDFACLAAFDPGLGSEFSGWEGASAWLLLCLGLALGVVFDVQLVFSCP
jgi:hypothetical protein